MFNLEYFKKLKCKHADEMMPIDWFVYYVVRYCIPSSCIALIVVKGAAAFFKFMGSIYVCGKYIIDLKEFIIPTAIACFVITANAAISKYIGEKN